jgi:hypothetical protein
MGKTIKAMQLLALSGVTMAAGAMISLSFAVSPPLTLLPPRPVPVDASGNVTSHRTSETVGAAIANAFERRWQATTDDIPPVPVPLRKALEDLTGGLPTLPLAQDAPPVTQVEPQRDPLEGLIGGLPMLPLTQDAPQMTQVEPPRDPLEGLIGGLPMLPLAQDAPQVRRVEPHNLAAAPLPEQQELVTVVLQEPPARPSDVCARRGLRRVDYTQNHHRHWRCADRQ